MFVSRRHLQIQRLIQAALKAQTESEQQRIKPAVGRTAA